MTRLVPRESWQDVVRQERDGGYAFFDLLTAVDLEDAGFEVVLHLWHPQARSGLLLRTHCPRTDSVVPTLTGLFAGAAWHERATAELFGLRFEGHETAPLLLPERFEGHPLRKEFVLASREAKPWPGAKDPGESDADLLAGRRRRPRPPGAAPGWRRP